MRKAAFVGFCALSLALAVGGATGEPGSASNVSTCAIPYTFHVGRQSVLSGSCSGLLLAKVPRITIRLRQRFSVQILHEQNGSLDYPVPRPSGSAVRRVGPLGTSDGYVGRTVGTSELVAHGTPFCQGIDPGMGSCPVLKVRVTAR